MGRIALNMLATSILQAKKATHAVILWDKDTNKCALRLASSKDVGAYTLTYNDKSNGAGFSAVTFLNYIRYDWTATRSFNAEWDEAAEMLIFTVPKEHFGTSGNLVTQSGRAKRSDKEKEVTEVTP
jgi:hypothetical protein